MKYVFLGVVLALTLTYPTLAAVLLAPVAAAFVWAAGQPVLVGLAVGVIATTRSRRARQAVTR